MMRLMKLTAMRFSDKTALVNAERSRRFTFEEFHFITNKICNLLTGHFRLNEGDRYATLLEKDNLSIFHLWSLKSPATCLWLGYRESQEEHFYQIDFVKPKVIFIESARLGRYYGALRERGITIVVVDQSEGWVGVLELWPLLNKASEDEPNHECVADDAKQHVCILRFTGGTTGKPKCAAYTVNNMIAAAYNSIHYS